MDATTVGVAVTSVTTIAGAAWAGLKSFRKYVQDEADERIKEREDLRKELEAKFNEKSLADAEKMGAQNERLARLEGSINGVRKLMYGWVVDLTPIPNTEAIRARIQKAADEL